MRYLVKPTKSEAWDVSGNEAIERGCNGTTTHWYGVQPTADGQWCVMIDDDKELDGSTDESPVFMSDSNTILQ